MSLVSVETAILDVIAAVPDIDAVILGPPTSVQVPALAYLVATSGERNPSPPSGRVIKNRFHLTLTVCVPTQDNPAAEEQISAFVDSIQIAIRTAFWQQRLEMWVARWETDTRVIGGESGEAAATYRVVDFTIDVVEADAF